MTERPRIPEAQLDELRQRHPCSDYAGGLVALRRKGRGFIGPCPLHSKNRRARDSTSFECDAESWKCAVCCDGGDVIKLVQQVEGLGFLEAVERLGGTRPIDEERQRQLEAERERKAADRERVSHNFRERERETCWDIWDRALHWVGTPAEAYLKLRGLDLPTSVRLRCVPAMPYFHPIGSDQVELHRGPAMLAPILRPDAHFGGLHFTYLDLSQPKGKAKILHPETGEELAAKKSRGSKRGGFIELLPVKEPRRMIIGEGIEKVGAVLTAFLKVGRDVSQISFRTSVDLGNLGGRASETIAHPAQKTDKGRAQKVSGPEPDLEAPSIPIPPTVEDVVILGDSTSDRIVTECAIARASARWSRPSLAVRVAWAPDGADFDDLLRGAA